MSDMTIVNGVAVKGRNLTLTDSGLFVDGVMVDGVKTDSVSNGDNLSVSMRERFCKDMKVPIKIFESPYFEERLRLFDPFFKCISTYKEFVELVSFFGSDRNYFEAYTQLKDDVIKYLTEKERVIYFSQKEDMSKFSCENKGFPTHEIYKNTFDGKLLCSIDMKKGDFTSLHYYDPSIVGNKSTYEDFLGMFTDKEYFKKSKYIRQIIFGNVCPKRQVTLEKYMMDKILTKLFENGFEKEEIVFFSTDEIVICLDKYAEKNTTIDGVCETVLDTEKMDDVLDTILGIVSDAKKQEINVRAEFFELRRIPGTSGYIKKFRYNRTGVEFKCLDFLEYPFVLRAYLRELPKESDFVFIHEGHKVKLLDKIEVEVV